MRVLVIGLNFSPELIGIGPYTAQFAEFLAHAGHEVSVIAGKPYYPEWQTHAGFAGWGYRRSQETGLGLWRCPIYVPSRPSGLKRVVQHLSFALSTLVPLAVELIRRPPDMIFTIAPSLMSAPLARWAGRLTRARTWLHVQDFEIEAAFATGLMAGTGWIARAARTFERWAMSGFSRYSSISPQMCRKLTSVAKSGVRAFEFRNWSDIREVTPTAKPSGFRAEWGIVAPYVALYSGNLSNKQGIGMIAEAASMLRDRTDLMFVICGEGAGKAGFIAASRHLPNVQVHPLQARGRLQDLMALATVHMLPQLKGAADLMLPSKLTNMLASGRPIIATADPGTGLADEVAGCGVVTEPGCAKSFADAIETVLADTDLRQRLGMEARRRAEDRWAKPMILEQMEREMIRCLPADALAKENAHSVSGER